LLARANGDYIPATFVEEAFARIAGAVKRAAHLRKRTCIHAEKLLRIEGWDKENTNLGKEKLEQLTLDFAVI